MNLKQLIIVLLFCVFNSACSPATQTNGPTEIPEIKTSTPTSQKTNPTSSASAIPTSEATRSPEEIPLGKNIPLIARGWKSADFNTVCLQINQKYPELSENYSEPVTPAVEELLKLFGLEGKSSDCDADLAISLIGKGAYATYQVSGEKSGERCFNGGQYIGEIRLSAAGYEDLIVNIEGKYIPKGVKECLPEPSPLADYEMAWAKAIMDGFEEIWGVPGLLQALGHSSLEVQIAAATALDGQKGLDANNLPILVDALNINNMEAQKSVLIAIKRFGNGAWEAIPSIIFLWESMGDDAYHPFLAQQWGEYHNALVKITTGTNSPGDDCSGPAGLKCWKAWWGDGRPAP